MINKQVVRAEEALLGIGDGAVILCGGFGAAGSPNMLFDALLEMGVRDLVIVANNAGQGYTGLAGLVAEKRVRKVICSFPRDPQPTAFDDAYRERSVELELVPQGTLSERIRAAGAGIGGFFVRTATGTELGGGKEVREIDGQTYVYETPIKADAALIFAEKADRWGNLVYRKAARNFNPVMATAAALTVAEVRSVVDLGSLDPESIHTPGIFVDRFILTERAK